MLFEVLTLPGRFCQKYCSCGGRSWGGVGVLFRRPRLRFEGVAGTADSAASSSSISSCWSSLSSSSASHIFRASKSSSSKLSSSLSPSVAVRSSSVLALFRRAERSALWMIGPSIWLSSLAGALEGVEKSFLPFGFRGVAASSSKPTPLASGFRF